MKCCAERIREGKSQSMTNFITLLGKPTVDPHQELCAYLWPPGPREMGDLQGISGPLHTQGDCVHSSSNNDEMVLRSTAEQQSASLQSAGDVKHAQGFKGRLDKGHSCLSKWKHHLAWKIIQPRKG